MKLSYGLSAASGVILSSLLFAQSISGELRFTIEPAGVPRTLRGTQYVDSGSSWIGRLNTRDAGRSWRRFLPPKIEQPHFAGDDPELADTFFVNATRGWLVSHETALWTWQTDDGGLTWRRWRRGAMLDLVFVGDGHGWTSIY